MPVTEIRDSERFKKISSISDKLIVIDFGAEWCGPCKRIAPMYEQLSDIMKDVVFCKVDIDEFEELAQNFDVISVPTFVFIKNNNILTTVQGANYDLIVSECNKYA
jgi:thioredoxin 1